MTSIASYTYVLYIEDSEVGSERKVVQRKGMMLAIEVLYIRFHKIWRGAKMAVFMWISHNVTDTWINVCTRRGANGMMIVTLD